MPYYSEHDERLAIRNAATMAQAQATFDNMAEPECSDEETDLQAWAEHLTMLANDALEQIGRAERAAAAGQIEAARDMLECAARQLGDLA
jgi:hypothetical protein